MAGKSIKKEAEKHYCKYCATYIRRVKDSLFYELEVCKSCIKDPKHPEKAVYDQRINDYANKSYKKDPTPGLTRVQRSRAKKDVI